MKIRKDSKLEKLCTRLLYTYKYASSSTTQKEYDDFSNEYKDYVTEAETRETLQTHLNEFFKSNTNDDGYRYVHEITGLKPNDYIEIQKRYNSYISGGLIESVSKLSYILGIEPIFDEKAVNFGYKAVLGAGGLPWSYSPSRFKEIKKITGVKPSKSKIKEAYSDILKDYVCSDYVEFDRLLRVKKLTGIDPDFSEPEKTSFFYRILYRSDKYADIEKFSELNGQKPIFQDIANIMIKSERQFGFNKNTPKFFEQLRSLKKYMEKSHDVHGDKGS